MYLVKKRAVRAFAAMGVAALALTACGTGSTSAADETVVEEVDVVDVPAEAPAGAADAVQEACQAGGDLLVWAWEPTLRQAVDAFEAEYPNAHVTLSNVGMGQDHYIAMQNAITAGTGVPDVAQVEFLAMGQFVITNSLADLNEFGAAALQNDFTPGPWSAVTSDGHVYALPTDSGPMALFYNADVFDEYGIEVPTTWDEYIEAARTVHAANPNIYFGTDWRDPNLANAIMWQAGGHPFQSTGTDVTINLETDPGAQKYAEITQQLQDDGLVSNINGWTDEWFTAFGNGTLATTVAGAWMPLNLMGSSPAGSGSWRVAPMPQMEAGQHVTAEQGGSGLAVLELSQNKPLAYCFVEFVTHGGGVAPRLAEGAFPATVADLNNEEFLNREFEYFGGQQINRVLSESAGQVPQGWQFLPYQVYANSIFPDTVGQAFIGSGTVAEGLANYQSRLNDFGAAQGFTMGQ